MFPNLPTYLLWLTGGLLTLAVSSVAPEPTIFALGVAAIITAIAALSVTNVSIQFLIWAILAVILALLLRGLVPAESAAGLEESPEANVQITIPRGGVGEVSYEGSYWSARCQISDVSITAGETVRVVGRQGNTLIVLPIQSAQGLGDRFPRHGS
jgi:membrane protein implicated in regulation of membrane protease activity